MPPRLSAGVLRLRRCFATIATMFQSPTWGQLELPQLREKILNFLSSEPQAQYQLVIGTDSQPHNGLGVDFVTAIVVHRKGYGGVYFWQRRTQQKPYVLRRRMYEEATLSLTMAENIIGLLHQDGITRYDIEIHVDVGDFGPTREMIAEIVGMVTGNGYRVKTKPESYAASKVADRHT